MTCLDCGRRLKMTNSKRCRHCGMLKLFKRGTAKAKGAQKTRWVKGAKAMMERLGL